RAAAGDAPRPDLAAVGDVLTQEGGVLVVDVLDAFLAERANLLLGLAHRGLCHRGAPRNSRVEPGRSCAVSRPGWWIGLERRLVCGGTAGPGVGLAAVGRAGLAARRLTGGCGAPRIATGARRPTTEPAAGALG